MTGPYYEDPWVTLYHGDCLEVTEWLAADVLITDPPYGVGGRLSFDSRVRHDWDDLAVRDAVLEMWGDRPRAVFGSPRRLDAAPAHREVPLVWDRGNVVASGDTAFPWRPTYELIYVGGAGWHGHRGVAVMRSQHHSSVASTVGHPTPKPIGLMSELVLKAPPGVVADPFAGSGSTLVAAKASGRRAIGVEIEERYCEIAARRLAQDALDFGEGA